MQRRTITRTLGAALLTATLTIAPSLEAAQAAGSTRWPLVKTAFDSTIYELTDNRYPDPISPARWRDHYGNARPSLASTDYVKYSWSSTIYAETTWYSGPEWTNTSTDILSPAQWSRAGRPAPRTVGRLIAGSSLVRWATSGEIILYAGDRSAHKLTPSQWAATGYESYNQGEGGFLSLSWAPRDIVYAGDLRQGPQVLQSYQDWASSGFPTPRRVTRVPHDTFYQFRGEQDIYYSNSWMQRRISYAEWRAAGSPRPEVY